MKKTLILSAIIAIAVLISCNTKSVKEDVAIEKKTLKPEMIFQKKIWDNSQHNAFTNLIFYKDNWYCTFREAQYHLNTTEKKGTIRVLKSKNFENWESVLLLENPGVDLRDSKFSISPDNRLIVHIPTIVQNDKLRDSLLGTNPRETHTGAEIIEAYIKCNIDYPEQICYTDDGENWSELINTDITDNFIWCPAWYKDTMYVVGYWTYKGATLFKSTNAIDHTVVTEFDIPGSPNEVAIRFKEDGTMIAWARRDKIKKDDGDNLAYIGQSKPPYTEWEWNKTKSNIGGPNFLVLPDGNMPASGRYYHKNEPKLFLGYIDSKDFYPQIELPSGGDCSYAGMVWKDDILWMTYYSSHEEKTSIYTAKVKLY